MIGVEVVVLPRKQTTESAPEAQTRAKDVPFFFQIDN